MCLAIPARIVAFTGEETATVDIGGIRKEISLSLVDHAKEGDYVIVHVGFAISRLDPDEARRTLELFMSLGPDEGPEKQT
jgi:hydrogenase expression/formation protein HypC